MKFFAVFTALVCVAASQPTWTLSELSEALQNPNTDPAMIPALEQALNELMDAIYAGHPVEAVALPAMDITTWTLQELSEALENPATNPALVPYLEQALNQIMEALVSGQQMEAIAVAIPAGLVPAPVAPVAVPAPAETPMGPAASSSPLVQIIINLRQQA